MVYHPLFRILIAFFFQFITELLTICFIFTYCIRISVVKQNIWWARLSRQSIWYKLLHKYLINKLWPQSHPLFYYSAQKGHCLLTVNTHSDCSNELNICCLAVNACLITQLQSEWTPVNNFVCSDWADDLGRWHSRNFSHLPLFLSPLYFVCVKGWTEYIHKCGGVLSNVIKVNTHVA